MNNIIWNNIVAICIAIIKRDAVESVMAKMIDISIVDLDVICTIDNQAASVESY